MDHEETIGRITKAVTEYRYRNRQRISSALDAGEGLLELKVSGAHGEFLPLLGRLSLPARTARDWMHVARAGVKTATVAHFGGIRGTLERLRAAKRILGPPIPDAEYTERGSEFYCPTCVPGSTAWNLPDGRCRAHPLSFTEAMREYQSTDWDSEIGQALNELAA